MAKNVLITGCSSGIGRALCQQFLARGFVVFASARDTQDLASLQHENLHTFTLDVNQDAHIEAVTSAIKQRFGRLDYLINNAGFAKMGPIIDLTRADFNQQFATNVISPAMLTKACVPLLLKSKQPVLVNIGSVSGILTTPFSGAYCASKAALHALNDALRLELSTLGIKVICVQPGGIESNFAKNSLAQIGAWIDNSVYFSHFKQRILARAKASQDNPTSNTEFSEKLVIALISDPDAIIRLGNGSKLLPFIGKWFPTWLSDKILAKRFFS